MHFWMNGMSNNEVKNVDFISSVLYIEFVSNNIQFLHINLLPYKTALDTAPTVNSTGHTLPYLIALIVFLPFDNKYNVDQVIVNPAPLIQSSS